jgi:hypothetical protein
MTRCDEEGEKGGASGVRGGNDAGELRIPTKGGVGVDGSGGRRTIAYSSRSGGRGAPL